MKLYVMRHGPAEDHADSGVDADRALTASGRDRVRAVAKVLVDAGESPAHIVTSPLVRAVQTAEIVALVTKLFDRGGTVEVRRALAPGGDASRLALGFASEQRRRVLFVGHEPDLSTLVARLVGSFARSFDKAMVVGAHLPDDGARPTLRFLLDPKALRLEPAPPTDD
jgi:phosphohistidine phosphatase